MDKDDESRVLNALQGHEVDEVSAVHLYAGYVNGHGEVTFRVKDRGKTPRWSVVAIGEDGQRLGSDVQDDLSIAVTGVLMKIPKVDE